MDRQLGSHFAALERARGALIAELRGYSDDALNAPPAPGAWSALQTVQHVIRAEQGTVAYVGKKTAHPEAVERAPLKATLRSAVLTLFLRSPLRFAAPPFTAEIPPRSTLAETAALWETARGELEELLRTFPPELRGASVFRHPRLGPMRLPHALRFMREHLRRHRGQIDRALAAAPDRSGTIGGTKNGRPA